MRVLGKGEGRLRRCGRGVEGGRACISFGVLVALQIGLERHSRSGDHRVKREHEKLERREKMDDASDFVPWPLPLTPRRPPMASPSSLSSLIMPKENGATPASGVDPSGSSKSTNAPEGTDGAGASVPALRATGVANTLPYLLDATKPAKKKARVDKPGSRVRGKRRALLLQLDAFRPALRGACSSLEYLRTTLRRLPCRLALISTPAPSSTSATPRSSSTRSWPLLRRFLSGWARGTEWDWRIAFSGHRASSSTLSSCMGGIAR